MKAGVIGFADAEIARNADVGQMPSPDFARADTFQRQIVKTVEIALQVDSIDSALAEASALANQFGGYVASQSRSEAPPDGARNGTVTLKIPASRTDQGLAQLKKLGKAKNETMWTEDVTEDFYDTTIRLKNAQITRTRFELILQGATKVPEVVEVQRELSRVTEEIERITGHLRRLSHQVTFSTVTLTVSEPLPILRDRTTVGGRLAEALRDMVDMFWRTIVGAIRLLGFVAPTAALGLMIFWATRWVWRLRRNKRASQKG
jgi:hypothetical protein